MAGPDSSRSPLSPGSPRPSESAKESKAERKVRKLEKALSAKLSAIEEMERELRQARGQARELREQVAQLRRENLSLRQQLVQVQEMAQHGLAEGVGAATPMAGPDSSRSPLSPGSPRPSESAKESKAERKVRKLEKALSAKLSAIEEMERELRQARGQARELREQVAQLRRENLSLRQQLVEVQEMAQHRLAEGVGAATPMAGPDSSRSPLSPGSPRPSESAKESKAERKVRKLEKALSAKLSLSEEMERELRQARGQARELREQVAQLRRENLSLRQQLVEVQEMAQHRTGDCTEVRWEQELAPLTGGKKSEQEPREPVELEVGKPVVQVSPVDLRLVKLVVLLLPVDVGLVKLVALVQPVELAVVVPEVVVKLLLVVQWWPSRELADILEEGAIHESWAEEGAIKESQSSGLEVCTPKDFTLEELREHDRELSVCERSSEGLETNPSLSQQESKEEAERELCRATKEAEELRALLVKKDEEIEDAIKEAEGLREQLVQMEREYISLCDQRVEEENKAEEKVRKLKEALSVKTYTLEQMERELCQALRQAEKLQDQLAHRQRENLSLREQLLEMQKIARDPLVEDVRAPKPTAEPDFSPSRICPLIHWTSESAKVQTVLRIQTETSVFVRARSQSPGSAPETSPSSPHRKAANKVPSRDTSALVPTALILGEQETPSSQVATPRAHLQAVPQQQVRTLELEQVQHRLLLESLQQWHREDLELLESAHRSWVKVMEETYRQREERLQQEKEQLMAQLLSQSQDAEQAQAELVAQHQQCLATLEQQRTLELEQQRTLELEQLRELQRSLNGVIEQFSSDLHNLLHKVEARHHSTGHCDQQLKVLQDWMSQQQRDMEERLSQKAQEVIARMETRLGEHTRLLEQFLIQKRWRATAEQSEVESLQHLLKEQRQIMTQQLSIERAELERAKSALLEKEKSVMQKCSEERQKLAAEWAEVRTQQQLSKEWMKHEVERTLQMHSQREGTILSLAKEQADLKIRSRELKAKEEQLARDRELLDEAWRELRLEKEKVNRSALRIQQQEEKIKSMTNLSSQKYDEGERALREACRMESEQQSRLQVTQQHQHLHEANTPSPAHLGLGPPCQGPEPLPTASLSPFSWGWGMAYQRQQLQNLCEDLPSNSAMLLTTEQDLSAPVRGLSTLSAAAPHSWEAVPGLPPPLRMLDAPSAQHGEEQGNLRVLHQPGAAEVPGPAGAFERVPGKSPGGIGEDGAGHAGAGRANTQYQGSAEATPMPGAWVRACWLSRLSPVQESSEVLKSGILSKFGILKEALESFQCRTVARIKQEQVAALEQVGENWSLLKDHLCLASTGRGLSTFSPALTTGLFSGYRCFVESNPITPNEL
ncbi:trichohyalin-like [Cuculus canorus]|uniref:trichohyalin-like n=1 Tax=Cuculus canorus TaxID=55661 RepID=UPI0023AAEEBB|nr:trichohyalin-like [Cuculus canorus]